MNDEQSLDIISQQSELTITDVYRLGSSRVKIDNNNHHETMVTKMMMETHKKALAMKKSATTAKETRILMEIMVYDGQRIDWDSLCDGARDWHKSIRSVIVTRQNRYTICERQKPQFDLSHDLTDSPAATIDVIRRS